MSTVIDERAGYRQAFLDWLACALGGRTQAAPAAARSAAVDPIVVLGAAGHVLDFDDTYAPGLAHLTAPVAPAALVIGAETGASIGDVLDAYAAGFEAMAALAEAGHPALYERGWHPTAVTGTVGAATATARLLGLDPARTGTAQRLAVLGAGGLRAAFGSDGKSLQVGFAAAQGARAAKLAANGASATGKIPDGYERAFGAPWADPDGRRAIAQNWIKAFPCCLQTHSAIEAAEVAAAQGAGRGGRGTVTVHPRSRQAAPFDDVDDGLQAKFSIPYTSAFTILHGAPSVADFAGVDPDARELASRIAVRLDDELAESEAVLEWNGDSELIAVRIDAARGSPQHPMSEQQLADKVHALAGDRLDGALDDPGLPAGEVLTIVMAS